MIEFYHDSALDNIHEPFCSTALEKQRFTIPFTICDIVFTRPGFIAQLTSWNSGWILFHYVQNTAVDVVKRYIIKSI